MTTENYEYIAELVYSPNTGLYDLFLTTFNGNINVINYRFFFCERKHAGRLDLVSSDIYDTNKWVGTLCQLNNMPNMFSVRDGDIILYLPETDNQALLNVPENIAQPQFSVSQVKNDLINALKKKKPDALRARYLNNRQPDALPPTILPDNVPQVVTNNAKIKIAPNLFAAPTPTPAQEDNTSPLLNAPSSPSGTGDDIQRVLVRRYIKIANG